MRTNSVKQRWQAVAGAMAVVVACGAGTARALDLPPDIRTGANVDPFRDTIDKYVKTHLAAITGDDRKAADSARDEFFKQVETANPAPPSSAFVTSYMRAASAELPNLLASPDVNKRLAAAIVLARLSNTAPTNPDLVNVVEKAMAGKEPSVTLWGVKAVGNMLPALVRLPPALNKAPARLIAGLLAAAKANLNVGPIVQDAYNALALPDPQANQPAYPSGAFSPSIKAINEMLAARTAAYANGVPQYPQAERVATSFLSRESVRNSMSPKEKGDSIRALVGLMVAGAKQAPNAGGAKRDVDLNIIAGAQLTNSLLDSMGPNAARGPLREVGEKIKPGQTGGPDAGQLVDTAVTAVQKMPQFGDLRSQGAIPNAAPSAVPSATP